MSFNLPPRPSLQQQYDNYHGRTVRKNRTWGLGSGYHAVDKARFVYNDGSSLVIRSNCNRYIHSNYRFIVDPRQDYHAQTVDADVYLDWNNVQQILASPISQGSSCPICLGDPVAPRMARCGHIYCLPCLIRYMHATEEVERQQEKRARWKKCAICHDSIYISETRPVRWYSGQEGPMPRENDDIVLRLVKRPAGSTLALPRESYSVARSDEVPWHFAADAMDFARIMKGTEDYMEEQFEREIEDLRELERHDELMFGEDAEWTSKAVRSIVESKEKIKGLGNAPIGNAKPEKIKPTQAIASNGTSTSADSALSTSLAQFRAQAGLTPGPSDYHFYQALPHFYLSGLDIRILKAAFGDYTTFPSTILPRIERVSTGHIVDDELRKRSKFLGHLPHGCEVAFLECDWTDTVPADVLEAFKVEIEKRRKRNSDKEAREEKDRVRAEREEEDKRYAAARRRRLSDVAERFQPDDFQPLQAPSSLEGGYESTSPMWSASRGKGPGFSSLASPGTSPNTTRTVWGTTVIQSSPTLEALQEPARRVDDGWLQDWEKDLLTQDDDIIAQVEAMSLAGESSSSKPAPGQAKKGKKSKKGITVFTTSGRRGL